MIVTGLARADITPEESVPLFGYGDRTHDSTGVHDTLCVYAWWLQPDGEPPAAWVLLDLCVIGIDAAAELARAVCARAAIPGLLPQRILVSTTHTHSGPDTLAIHDDTRPWAPRYRELLVQRIAAALIEARQRSLSCRIDVRLAQGTLGVNRRDPRKPVDPRIILFSLIDGTGKLRGLLFHYSCHLTVLGVDNHHVSADWVGPVRDTLENELGVPVAFLQGAEVNIDPHTRGFLDMADPDQARGSSFDVLGQLADTVTEALRAGLRSARVESLGTFQLSGWDQELPLRYGALSREEVRARIEEWKRGFAQFLAIPAGEVPEGRIINALVKERSRALALPPAEVRRQVAAQFAYGNFLVTYGRDGDRTRGAIRPERGVVQLPCRLLDFSSVCILCAPAEILIEVAFDWQRALPGRIALVSGLVGGWMGYMPHAGNFAEPEAEERYETVSTSFAPSASAVMLDSARGRVRDNRPPTPPPAPGCGR